MKTAPSSILRRSAGVTAFFVLGHGFHYLLLATGNRLLVPEAFGLFYTSISLINVIVTPGIVLTFVFAQRFASLAVTGGPDAVRVELNRTLGTAIRWGGVATAAIAALLVALGALVGVQSFLVVVLAPAVSLAVFLFETVRAAFQGLLRFAWFSTAWVFWRGLQYVLAAAGFYYLGTVWSGLAGILVATLLATLLMLRALSSRALTAEGAEPVADAFGTGRVVPFVIGYGLFTVLANADALIAYLVLDREALGVYASSSILPKAIVTATQPVAQIVLPVVVAQVATAASIRASLVKAVAATLGLGMLGWLVLGAAGELVCDSRFGLQFCDGDLLRTLALAAVPLGVLRVLVVIGLARGASGHTVVQALGLVAFSLVAFRRPGGAPALAHQYLAVCWGVTGLYAARALTAGAPSR